MELKQAAEYLLAATESYCMDWHGDTLVCNLCNGYGYAEFSVTHSSGCAIRQMEEALDKPKHDNCLEENKRLLDALRGIEAFALGLVQTQYTMDKAHRNLVQQIADRCRAELNQSAELTDEP